MTYNIMDVNSEHRQDVVDVYNYYVENSIAAYPSVPFGYEIFDQFLEKTEGYPFKVIKEDNGGIVGFAFLKPYHFADTLKRTADITYFILPEHTGKGLAGKILNEFIETGKKMGITQLLASISSLNEGSINFHRKHGFVECGRFKSVGCKFENEYDIIWMQLSIK